MMPIPFGSCFSLKQGELSQEYVLRSHNPKPFIVGGGLIGFTFGYVCRKLIKLAIIGLGLIFALLAFLAYQKWVKVDWAIVQSQTSSFIQTSMQKMLDIVNSTAQDLDITTLIILISLIRY